MAIQFEPVSDEILRETAKLSASLSVGTQYDFDPPMSASCIPQPENHLNGLPFLEFTSGTFIGMRQGRMIFEGYPADAPEKADLWKFFFVVIASKEGKARFKPARKTESE